MVVDNREAWKAREEDYRAQRRKRSRKSKVRARAKYLWDSADPAIRWENLIPTWQAAVTSYVRLLEAHVPPDEAWNESAPSHHTRWGSKLLGSKQETLEEVARADG